MDQCLPKCLIIVCLAELDYWAYEPDLGLKVDPAFLCCVLNTSGSLGVSIHL